MSQIIYIYCLVLFVFICIVLFYLYCIALFVLYCIVLYCIFVCIVLYCIVLYLFVLYLLVLAFIIIVLQNSLKVWNHQNIVQRNLVVYLRRLTSNVLLYFSDTQPPSFGSSCPNSTTFSLPKSENSMIVDWTAPTATDNSGMVQNISVMPVVLPPIRMTIGEKNITYTAVDKEGNIASCSFIIRVVGMSIIFFVSL